jgi:molybdopterin molybdotransferase
MAKAAHPSSKTATGTTAKQEQQPVLTVAQARQRILARVNVLEPEEVPISAAHGRVLGEAVRAERDVPPFPNSAMDGYAVRAADLRVASPKQPASLKVLGEIRAGAAPAASLSPKTALRIMTGAMLPSGADAVVRVEDTSEENGTVQVRATVEPGASVRPAGSDLRKGELVAAAGRLITPGLVGVLASAGRASLRCVRRPRVAVLTTGDELREPGEPLAPGEITNTNRYALRAAIEEAGGRVRDVGVARDERDDLAGRLRAAAESDLAISTGGVSMGAYDLVRGLLEEQRQVDFWQVALRPGKPLIFGAIGKVPLIGLPGNPVSALVGFELFVRPALLKMQGRRELEPRRVSAITEEPLHNPPHLEQYFRGIARRHGDQLLVRLTGDQGSHVLRSMADANCLIVVPQGMSEVAAGAAVDIIPLAPID